MERIAIINYGSDDYRQTLFLRDEILRKPLGLNIVDDNLSLESGQIHVAFYFHNQIVACLIIQYLDDTTAKIRQVCTMPIYHGWGFGKDLVKFAEDVIVTSGRHVIILHARESSIGFYLKLGYAILGEPFQEIGLCHYKMTKII